MARIKQPSGKRPPSIPDRSILLQLMGFPPQRNANTYADICPKTVQANWPKVMERLVSHPEEAKTISIQHRPDPHALLWALQNESTPLTVPVLRAFIQAYPGVVTHPRSAVVSLVLNNSVLAKQQEIVDILLLANPKHLSGRERTRTFQLMGFPSSCHEGKPNFLYSVGQAGGHSVDWQALETHLQEHPGEASIVCPQGGDGGAFIFPLEAAVQFESSPVPLSTVQLLLRLCPEAATISDSSALFMSCACRNQANPDVIRAILTANPSMAADTHPYLIDTHHERGLPLHEIVRMACAAQIAPDVIAAHPAALVDHSTIYGQTPLQVAVEESELSPDLLRVLLENGHRYHANVEDRGQLFFTGGPHYGEDEPPMAKIIQNATLIGDRDGRELRAIMPEYQDELDGVWQNLCLALQAAGAARTRMPADAMWEYPLLQGVIEFGEQQLYFDKILRENTNANQLDPLGRTPLTVAIEMAETLIKNYEDDDDNMQLGVVIKMLMDDQQGGSSALASIPIPTVDSSITILPLHRALQQGLQDGIEHIATAFPDALSIPDPASKLIPCLLAAVGDSARVGTIFALMMQRPNLIIDLC